MDLNELERLVEMVQNANIRELTLKQQGARITIRKSVSAPRAESMALVPVPDEMDFPELYPEEGYSPEAPSSPELFVLEEEPPLVSVTAPLVGVYRHVKPIVGLGAKVTQGQVVGIIEAMKLINEVMSPANGKVVDVLVDDGQPVEYGQELFVIKDEG